jgi:hypothetical protein
MSPSSTQFGAFHGSLNFIDVHNAERQALASAAKQRSLVAHPLLIPGTLAGEAAFFELARIMAFS